jgi:hypothetical protein
MARAGQRRAAWMMGVVALCASGCVDPSTDGHADGGSGRCATCHMPDYAEARGHVGKKPTTCGVCHSSEGWTPHVLRHRWALTGAHAEADCVDCHHGATPTFEGTKRVCVGCHLDTFQTETFPDHLGYPHECEQCHTTAAWLPATWNGRPIDAAEHAARVNGRAWAEPVSPADATPDAGVRTDGGAHVLRRVVTPRRPTRTRPQVSDLPAGAVTTPSTVEISPPPPPPPTTTVPPPPRIPPVVPDTVTSASRRR